MGMLVCQRVPSWKLPEFEERSLMIFRLSSNPAFFGGWDMVGYIHLCIWYHLITIRTSTMTTIITTKKWPLLDYINHYSDNIPVVTCIHNPHLVRPLRASHSVFHQGRNARAAWTAPGNQPDIIPWMDRQFAYIFINVNKH